MDRFLIESSHIDVDCNNVMEQFVFHGYINHFDWGCKAGVHTGWATIEAENASQALLSVPPRLRSTARAVRLNRYTPESIQKDHE